LDLKTVQICHTVSPGKK